MPRPVYLNSPTLSALKFTPQEKSAAQIGPDGLTEAQRGRNHSLGPGKIVALVDRFYRKEW